MKSNSNEQQSPVLFIPHGGGPLPLIELENNEAHGHHDLIQFLKGITKKFIKPKAILVISAHWEEETPCVTGAINPSLLYDYYGFPKETYSITYPAPGEPNLANKVCELLQVKNIKAKLDNQRGFDHGLFVPLKIMYPEASIPCIQLSLMSNLDPLTHIRIGEALTELRDENVLIVGSGFSFHNQQAFFSSEPDSKNNAFQDWLVDTCTNKNISETDREKKLIEWSSAPFASYTHPRSEHLLPLHVCYGLATSAAGLVYNGDVLGKKVCGFLW